MAIGLYVTPDGKIMVAYGARQIPLSWAQYKANGYKPSFENYWLNRLRRLYLVFRYCLQPYSAAKRAAVSNSAQCLLLSHWMAARGRSAPFEMGDGRAAPNSAAASLFQRSKRCRYPCYAVARGSENAGTPSWLILRPLARTASKRPPVAAGFFQVLALKCLSVYHLTIRPFNSLNSAALAKH
jgi:hypothetical protein